MQSSTYSAEYGRNPGGQFAFETKSGTNQWHGTAYDYLRNGFFDAHGLVQRLLWVCRNPPFGRMISAAHSGGPVEIPGLYNGKDKTFFFVSYEGLRLTAPQAATVNYRAGCRAARKHARTSQSGAECLSRCPARTESMIRGRHCPIHRKLV